MFQLSPSDDTADVEVIPRPEQNEYSGCNGGISHHEEDLIDTHTAYPAKSKRNQINP
jgi:hypothetical protein